jgi:hypothetical protein
MTEALSNQSLIIYRNTVFGKQKVMVIQSQYGAAQPVFDS